MNNKQVENKICHKCGSKLELNCIAPRQNDGQEPAKVEDVEFWDCKKCGKLEENQK